MAGGTGEAQLCGVDVQMGSWRVLEDMRIVMRGVIPS